MNHFFSQRLSGLMVADIGSSLVGEMRAVNDEVLMTEALNLLARGLWDIKKENVFLDGTIHLFNQPEFRDINKVMFCSTSWMTKDAWDLLSDAFISGIQVTIGRENQHEGFRIAALVTASLEIDGQVVAWGHWSNPYGL